MTARIEKILRYLYYRRVEQQRRSLQRLANIMDSSLPLGRSGFRIGLDPLIGLIPGFGDLISATISLYIVIQAAHLGASHWTLLRMLSNITIDMVVGTIPLLGDLFDFAFQANQRNVALLEKALASRSEEGMVDGAPRLLSSIIIFGVLIACFFAIMLVFCLWFIVKFLRWSAAEI